MKPEPFEAVLWDIAKRFEVLDVAYLADFIGPCHPDFYAGIKRALQNNPNHGLTKITERSTEGLHTTNKLASSQIQRKGGQNECLSVINKCQIDRNPSLPINRFYKTVKSKTNGSKYEINQ